MIKFKLLDPRNTPEAKASNDAIFASDPVLGIEITIPELAARCSLGNIDHKGNWAVIDNVYQSPDWDQALETENLVVTILKPDCDSIGAAAIFSAHHQAMRIPPEEGFNVFVGKSIKEELVRLGVNFSKDRIDLISKMDRFAKDPVWHPGSLPTRENPWPATGSIESSIETASLQAMCADNLLRLSMKVDFMLSWLNGLDCDYFLYGLEGGKSYINQVEKERLSLIASLESGEIQYCLNSGVAMIISTHRSATMIGYCLAPVVVAINPNFQFRDLPPVRKVTICAWSGLYLDVPAVVRDLSQLEPGWGGHGNICGSPQGISTRLTNEQIIKVVQHHL